jgi:hypothetical protein
MRIALRTRLRRLYSPPGANTSTACWPVNVVGQKEPFARACRAWASVTVPKRSKRQRRRWAARISACRAGKRDFSRRCAQPIMHADASLRLAGRVDTRTSACFVPLVSLSPCFCTNRDAVLASTPHIPPPHQQSRTRHHARIALTRVVRHAAGCSVHIHHRTTALRAGLPLLSFVSG